jgi:hypothetical protein
MPFTFCRSGKKFYAIALEKSHDFLNCRHHVIFILYLFFQRECAKIMQEFHGNKLPRSKTTGYWRDGQFDTIGSYWSGFNTYNRKMKRSKPRGIEPVCVIKRKARKEGKE